MAKNEKQRTQDPTTLSTRFTPAETEMLRKAAEAKGWSLSKLLRVGAYEKAVHILNLNGKNISSIRRVLADVVEQLFGAGLYATDGDASLGNVNHIDNEMLCLNVGIAPLNDSTFVNLITAIQNVGEELAPVLVEEHQRFVTRNTRGGDLRSKLISPSIPQPDAELEPEPTSESNPPPQRSKKSGTKSAKKKT